MYCPNCKKEIRKPAKRKRPALLRAIDRSPRPRTVIEQYMEYAQEHPEIILNLLLF